MADLAPIFDPYAESGDNGAGHVMRTTPALLASPTTTMIADKKTIWQRNVAPFDRWVSNGTALMNIPVTDGTSLYGPAGTPVSVGGAAFKFMDNFTRTNTSGGSLGPVTQASGNRAVRSFPRNWVFVNGTGGAGQIATNQYTSTAGQNSYATQVLTKTDLPSQKIRRVSADITWSGSSIPGGAVSTATIIISPDTTAAWQTHAAHFQINPYYIELDKLTSGGVVVVAGGNPAGFYPGTTPIALSTTVRVDCAFDDLGNYFVSADPGRTGGIISFSGNDPYLAGCLGPALLIQCLQGGTGYTVGWSDVFVSDEPLALSGN